MANNIGNATTNIPGSQNALLQVNDLRVSFFTPSGEVKALNGLSYELGMSEVVGIVGESGSGKSVSANALMGLLQFPGRVVGGTMHFNGLSIGDLTEKEMQEIRGKDVAMIFQDPMTSLNPVYTIGNQLNETIQRHMQKSTAEATKHAISMLNLVGISNPGQRMKQYPHELSGGMRQRVMIAMALCCQPKLLIADEPTTALDVTIQAQIMDLLKKLRTETDAAIVLITHDLGIVSDICDKVIVMYGGRIVERGSTDDIFYHTAHPYTKGLLACLPKLNEPKDRLLTPIEGSPVDLLSLPPGCAFSARCNKCMKICLRTPPPEFILNDASDDQPHTSSCWLHTIPAGVEG